MTAAANTRPNGGLAGRHAVVTGASRGIGAAIARALHDDGARVTLLGRHRASLEEVAGTLGTGIHVAVADVADPAAVESALAAATEALGPAHILVNNAGIARSAPLVALDPADWHAMLAVNLTGVYNTTRAVLPVMIERRDGRIVNVASTAGLKGYAYTTAYCASKHGVIGLTRALALETARKGITVNAVCPGFTDTDIVAESLTRIQAKTGRSREEALAELVANNPQGRLIRPEEVANAVLWLCRPGAESITGQAIAVAGGEVMG